MGYRVMSKLRVISLTLIGLGALLMIGGGAGLISGIGSGQRGGIILFAGLALIMASSPLYLASRGGGRKP